VASPNLATKLVQDPFDAAGRLYVTVSLTDPLEWCLSHAKITQAQYAVGLRFRKLYETAEVGGGVPAIDYSRPKIDGGYQGDPMPVGMMQANDTLTHAGIHLGQAAYSLLRLLVGQGRPIAEVAGTISVQTGEPLREASAHVRMALRSALEELGKHWQMTEAIGPRRSPLRMVRDQPIVRGVIDLDDELKIHDLRSESA
jgi:hypothetical protein